MFEGSAPRQGLFWIDPTKETNRQGESHSNQPIGNVRVFKSDMANASGMTIGGRREIVISTDF